MSEHTLKSVDEDLGALRRDVAELGHLAVDQVRAALEAFRTGDAALGAQVAAQDADLDERDAAIERAAIRFIALKQPVADDLRRPITAMKAAMNLERCGDLAKNIAKRVGQMGDAADKAQAGAVISLGSLVADRLEAVMRAYSASDAQGAYNVWAKDEEVDRQHEALFADILAGMGAGPETIAVGAHLMFMAKNLERVGDHATNIAEMVYYEITGQDLTGRPKL
jgi:phosphate transport system protein